MGFFDDVSSFFRLSDDFYLLKDQCQAELKKAYSAIAHKNDEEDEVGTSYIMFLRFPQLLTLPRFVTICYYP